MIAGGSIDSIIGQMPNSLDRASIELIFLEFSEIERRFMYGDWSPSECNAGRFCEALVRPLSLFDRGIETNHSPSVFADKLLNPDIDHAIRSTDRRNLARVIQKEELARDLGPFHTTKTPPLLCGA